MDSPLSLLKIQDNLCELQRDALDLVVSRCLNIPVAVICITGPSRSGKSFLLNFVHHYISEHWRRSCDFESMWQPFRSQAGISAVTHGVDIFSEPLFVRNKNHERMAVLLMDTQGLYDRDTSRVENNMLACFASFASSLLLVNVPSNLDECHFQSFHQVVTACKQAVSADLENPFQDLVFTIRDFCLDDDLTGWDGGQIVLTEFMLGSEKMAGENRDIRNNLISSFPEMKAFLFPHPGKKVTKKHGSDVFDPYFLSAMKEFVLQLPSILEPRRIDGVVLTGASFASAIIKITGMINRHGNVNVSSYPKFVSDIRTSQVIQETVAIFKEVANQYLCNFLSRDDVEVSLHEFIVNLLSTANDTLTLFKANPHVSQSYDIEYQGVTGSPLFILDKLLRQQVSDLIESLAEDAESANERRTLAVLLENEIEDQKFQRFIAKLNGDNDATKNMQDPEKELKEAEARLQEVKTQIELSKKQVDLKNKIETLSLVASQLHQQIQLRSNRRSKKKKV